LARASSFALTCGYPSLVFTTMEYLFFFIKKLILVQVVQDYSDSNFYLRQVWEHLGLAVE
jgi:hypothetical protein